MITNKNEKKNGSGVNWFDWVNLQWWKFLKTPEPFMIFDFCAISAFSSILLNLSGG